MKKASKGYKNAKTGSVYIFTNNAMPDILKIGMVAGNKHPQDRADELSRSTGVPGKYRVKKIFKTQDPYDVEQKIHSILKDFRYTANREFFKITIEFATEVIKKNIIEIREKPKKQKISHLQSNNVEKNSQPHNVKLRIRKADYKDIAKFQGYEKFIPTWYENGLSITEIVDYLKSKQLVISEDDLYQYLGVCHNRYV